MNSGSGKARLANARGAKLDFLLQLQKVTTRGNPKIKGQASMRAAHFPASDEQASEQASRRRPFPWQW